MLNFLFDSSCRLGYSHSTDLLLKRPSTLRCQLQASFKLILRLLQPSKLGPPTNSTWTSICSFAGTEAFRRLGLSLHHSRCPYHYTDSGTLGRRSQTKGFLWMVFRLWQLVKTFSNTINFGITTGQLRPLKALIFSSEFKTFVTIVLHPLLDFVPSSIRPDYISRIWSHSPTLSVIL